jgi:RNA polymerase I-specific transcription initiation factor RRN7
LLSGVQGFTQTQQDEDDFNIQGKISRKKGEEKERIRTVLTGRDATELYLQCYQLILWKQCFWLVSVKGFPKELETVVRDLWDLWLRIVHPHNEGGGYESGTDTLAFSSMSGGDATDTDGMSYTSTKSRSNFIGKGRLPKLIQTLALCYLGIMLMRFPTSLGEVYKWAMHEEMTFTRAVRDRHPSDVAAVQS